MQRRLRSMSVAAGTLLLLLGPACRTRSAPSAASTPSPKPLVVTIPEAPAAWDLEWARGAVFYQVFVRSFYDSDGDGIGDLKGLTAKLDYLHDLGVDGIWLMPVFASPSYHGYDVLDYETIAKDYGTNEDFTRLCAEAKKQGIRVIVDLVLNHTAKDHPWFVDSSSGPASAKRSWYVWRDDDPGWTQPWGGGATWHRSGNAYYYGLFWGGMPDLNWREPAVHAEMAGIARLWLDRGASGFRLDATRHLVETGPGDGQCDSEETHDVLRYFSAAVRAHRADALLVGENWTSTDKIARYYGSTQRVKGGDELPMSFDFPVADAIVSSVKDGDPSRLAAAIQDVVKTYPAGVLDAPFLTNHDMIRIATVLEGDVAKLKTAAAILLTLPGTPFVYYGEEVGLANGPGRDDQEKRTPMPWDSSPGGGFTTGTPWHAFAPGQGTANLAAERADPRSLWNRYHDLIRARHASRALAAGDIQVLDASAGAPAGLLAYVRSAGDERVLVAHNLSGAPATITSAPGGEVRPLYVDDGVVASRDSAGRWNAIVPGGASGVWLLPGR
jgi:alpha-amylase